MYVQKGSPKGFSKRGSKEGFHFRNGGSQVWFSRRVSKEGLGFPGELQARSREESQEGAKCVSKKVVQWGVQWGVQLGFQTSFNRDPKKYQNHFKHIQGFGFKVRG